MQEKQNIGSLFNRIAHSYDTVNHVLSLNIDKYWRRKAVKMLRSSAFSVQCSAFNILDVAIGTADLAIEIIKQHNKYVAKHSLQGAGGLVTGLDLSTEMMRIGAEKAAKQGMSEQISFVEGSALDMPFDDAQFDAITCGFGVRNFSDLDKGLREMYRVLRPNGTVIILEFSYPTNPIIRWVYNFYFSRLMPFIGRIISRDKQAYTYFYHSVKNFVWGKEMVKHLEQVGFVNVINTTFTFGIAQLYIGKKQ